METFYSLIAWWHSWGQIVFAAVGSALMIVIAFHGYSRNKHWFWWVIAIFACLLLMLPDILQPSLIPTPLVIGMSLAGGWIPILLGIAYFIVALTRQKAAGKQTGPAEGGTIPGTFNPPTCPRCGGPLDPSTYQCPRCNPIDYGGIDQPEDFSGSQTFPSGSGEGAVGPNITIIRDKPPVNLAWLTIASRVRAGTRFDLASNKQRWRVGKSHDNDVVIDDETISREHAVISLQNSKFIILDLMSTNGTQVNQSPIAGPTELKDGDSIRLGETELIFTKI